MDTRAIFRQQTSPLSDAFGRNISYLRLSVTDRCNLRCFYCMCRDVKFLPREEILNLQEMERLAAIFIRLGVRKLRITGGEPLTRPGIMDLVAQLGERLARKEFDELTLTTNGTELPRFAAGLVTAGMRRVNVSLDTLDATTFERISGNGDLHRVLEGIEAARAAGLAVRVNTVAMAGINDHEFDRLLAWCGERGCDMALIEIMPLGTGGRPRPEHYVPLDHVAERLARNWTLEPQAGAPGSPARYVRVQETGQRLGFITPLSHGFCQSCNRVRLTCVGNLVPCLARESGVDLKTPLRNGADDEAMAAVIRAAIAGKPHEHDLNRVAAVVDTQRMWQVGG